MDDSDIEDELLIEKLSGKDQTAKAEPSSQSDGEIMKYSDAPFVCEICQEKFQNAGIVQRHIFSEHDIIMGVDEVIEVYPSALSPAIDELDEKQNDIDPHDVDDEGPEDKATPSYESLDKYCRCQIKIGIQSILSHKNNWMTMTPLDIPPNVDKIKKQQVSKKPDEVRFD